MIYNKFIKALNLVSFLLVSTAFSVESISEEEANKYEVEYLKEYKELQKIPNELIVKWIQPKNKKEACKIYVGFDLKNDYTLKEDYALYWDGDCRDGYGYGLGREMEYRDYSYHYQIGIYKSGMPEDYCVNINEAEGVFSEGECHYSSKVNHKVVTIIKNKEADLSVEYHYGSIGNNQTPDLVTYSSPFMDRTRYYKAYPSFRYAITDLTNDGFDARKYQFNLVNESNKVHGFGVSIYKNGKIFSGETIEGKQIRKVILEQKYIDKYYKLLSEIQEASNKALIAQEKAKVIKTKYKMKICKDKIKVTFMDNDEYKAICEEDKKFAQLRVKMNEKLDRLNLAKQQKRQQLNEDKMRQAEQNTANKTEALAQQRVTIAEEALEEQKRANLNQGFQNLNQTLQLQQMNRNMSWDALTPKRFDVYMH